MNCRNFLVPYKRYESTCIEEVVSEEVEKAVVAADDSTIVPAGEAWYQNKNE